MRRGQRGLTLIEIALAVSILAIMGTLTFGTIARSWDAYEIVSARDARFHNVRTALNRMARDISMAFITEPQRTIDEDDQWKTIFKAKDSSPFYELHFTAFSHQVRLTDAKESDQSEISYFGDNDEDDRNQLNLMRREDNRLDSEPEEGGPSFILAEDIKSLKLRFWDAKDDDWTDEWDTEDKEYEGRLPTIVEIKMTFEDDNGEEITLVTKTRIFMPYLLR